MRKNGWIVIALWILLVSAGCLKNLSLEDAAPRISKEEVRAMLGQPDVVILDVRVEEEWRKSDWKISGAVHQNPEKIKEWSNQYPKEKTFVFYCS
jgi:rhodanese-related sulfurtransferase